MIKFDDVYVRAITFPSKPSAILHGARCMPALSITFNAYKLPTRNTQTGKLYKTSHAGRTKRFLSPTAFPKIPSFNAHLIHAIIHTFDILTVHEQRVLLIARTSCLCFVFGRIFIRMLSTRTCVLSLLYLS